MPLQLQVRGPILRGHARAVVSHLPRSIAEREVAQLASRLDWPADAFTIEDDDDSTGPGNVVMVQIQSAAVTEVFTGFGQRGVRAEQVADAAADEALAYLAADVPVGPHLCDQLVLLMALSGCGSFCTSPPTPHALTQLAVTEAFLGPVVRARQVAMGRWWFEAG